MSLAKIELTEETKLVFEVEVTGTKDAVSEHRLVIENDEFSIFFKGTKTKNGVEVKMPKLKNILGEGIYKTSLEIIIGDKIFRPMTEVIEILPNIEMTVESKTPEKKEKEDVKVKIGKTEVVSAVQEAKEKGYMVVMSGNKTILKQNDKYVGLIEDDNMIFSDVGHEFLTDLLDDLNK